MARLVVTEPRKLPVDAADCQTSTLLGLPCLGNFRGCAFPSPSTTDVPLYLAPMAGVSESPFRRLCRPASAPTSSSRSSSRPRESGARTRRPCTSCAFGPDERPIGVQIFGADPVAMGEAARFVSDVFQPEFIDINFGCPVKKVVRRNGGSGCLARPRPRAAGHPRRRGGHAPAGDVQDPQRLERGDARSGADRAPLPGRRRQGAHAASAHAHADVHRATRAGRRSPPSPQALDIPVLGNGDIKVAEDAIRMHEQTRLRRHHDRAAARTGSRGSSTR